MEPIYRKVFIKSQADLPEEEGDYYVYAIIDSTQEIKLTYWHFYPNEEQSLNLWIEFVYWYLQPVELPSDEEIKLACPQTLIARISCWIQDAKWLRDKLINK